jgi:hypothetical protein
MNTLPVIIETFQTQLEKTVAYFYNEHYGAYFGVINYQLEEDGSFKCGTPSGIYDQEAMEKKGIPFMGIKKENKNILYL